MIRCRSCRHEVSPEAKVCYNCGCPDPVVRYYESEGDPSYLWSVLFWFILIFGGGLGFAAFLMYVV